ncbi:MAG TPA: transglycosylase SLT domain-containing protein [Burkholderiales bacterium]|nr:transglycosylase SLT domain-containing protein [Burkholderiales bacterium]
MTAKSASQLPVSPLNRARGAAHQVHGTFLILALAVLMTGAAWFIDREANATVAPPAVAAVQPTPVATVQPAAVPETPEAVAVVAAAPVAEAAPEPETARENQRYKLLSEFLAKRYRVSKSVTLDLVTMAHVAGQQVGVDPLLIIAVIAVESRFNPIAESVMGAKGLMQIIPRYHTDKLQEFGGVKAVFDPETNILVGSKIIKEYLGRTGRLDSALQLYAGSTSEENEYFGKVMLEKRRLLQVLRRSS